MLLVTVSAQDRKELNDPFDIYRGKLLVPSDSGYFKNGEGSTIKLHDGRLMHMVSRHKGYGDFSPANIARMYSTDGGLNWTKPEIVFSNSDSFITVMQPSLIYLANGNLGVSYSKYQSSSRAIKVFRYSADDGKNWSDEIVMTPTDGYYSGAHHRMLVLSSGRILYPLHTKIGQEAKGPVRIFTRVAYSDDNGHSWNLSSQTIGTDDVSPEQKNNKSRAAVFAEASIAELSNGDVLMLARTIAGYLYQSVSKDKGLTWSKSKPTGLVSPPSSLNLVRIPGSGDLMLIWQSCCVFGTNTNLGARLTMSSVISTDGGNTWKWNRELVNLSEEDGRVEYPAISFDGPKVIITYRAFKPALKNIMEEHLLIFPVKWFYVEHDYNDRQNGFRKVVGETN